MQADSYEGIVCGTNQHRYNVRSQEKALIVYNVFFSHLSSGENAYIILLTFGSNGGGRGGY